MGRGATGESRASRVESRGQRTKHSTLNIQGSGQRTILATHSAGFVELVGARVVPTRSRTALFPSHGFEADPIRPRPKQGDLHFFRYWLWLSTCCGLGTIRAPGQRPNLAGGSIVPEEHPRIARRFIAGSGSKQNRVPQGRLKFEGRQLKLRIAGTPLMNGSLLGEVDPELMRAE